MAHPLREFRDRNGLRLEDLAARVGASISMLSRIEAGRARPSFKLLKRLVEETGTSADEFLSYESPDAVPAPASTEGAPA